MSLQRRLLLLFCVVFVSAQFAFPDDSAFDLDGPQIHVTVTRGATALPIAQVPSLRPDDQIWLRPELPPDQTVHYVLIVAFLRGSTNPPPVTWFTKAETWTKSVRKDGIRVIVPQGAEHVLLLMAPDTGGGFTTVRSALESQPGVFVRATEDLNQANLDRSRVDTYLSAVKLIGDTDPPKLEKQSKLLARSLGIKINEDCFEKPANQQPSCLTKDSNGMVMDDSHTQSVVASLTSADNSALFTQLSTTSIVGGGLYSPYVGAVVDVVHLMGSLHTADYVYIPALSLVKNDLISLKLNTPPSFRKPKSVLVIGMPSVQVAQFPPLRAVNANEAYCLESPTLVLPVEGAPLVFSTSYAHNMELQISTKTGEPVEVAANANPTRGGYVTDGPVGSAALPENGVIGKLQGSWGFDTFQGPSFHLQRSHPSEWTVVAADKNALIVGRKDTFEIQSSEAPCVHEVTVKDAEDKTLPVKWKQVKANTLQVQVAMENAAPGPLTLGVQQYGMEKPDQTKLHAYTEAATLGGFTLYSGDQDAVLEGTRLDEVVNVELKGIHLLPSGLTHKGETDALHLALSDAAASPAAGKDAVKNSVKEADKLAALKPNEAVVLHVTLKDGRVLNLPVTIQPSRPRVTLISKTVQPAPSSAQSGTQFANQDDLPQNGRLSFFLKSVAPSSFPRTESIEVAASDGSFHTMLTFSNGTLILQDAQTVLAELDPVKSFGASAFGALQFRPVDERGVAGDWQPLASLVRLPILQQVRCPMSPGKPCTLSGSDLFLLDSIASDPRFLHSVTVPIGFAGSTLSVPRPNGGLLYIKLRDDPKSVNMIGLPVTPEMQ
ncbi:MAG TPA: hypothetical protein VHX63_15510 [Acidobacteriaceae bacterium]|jgi:hypothetical protein|nr:hypothetical protein [Acidobacteriaceae bacterium]